MRRLVIPDIHENIGKVAQILIQESYDECIYLGDWVDRFPTQPGDLQQTLAFLLGALRDPKNVFLYGNHDMPYAFPSIYALKCSGHQWKTQTEIETVFTGPLAQAKFRPYYEADGYLFSHAGLANIYKTPDWEDKVEAGMDQLYRGEMSYFFGAGVSRGGYNKKGGLTWLDWIEEFSPVEDLRQIVGHTKGNKPRRNADNYCIDTGLDHYGILEDSVFTVYNFDGTEYQADEMGHEVKPPRRMQANQQEYIGKFHRTEHVEITTPDILLATCAYVGCIPVPEASPR